MVLLDSISRGLGAMGSIMILVSTLSIAYRQEEWRRAHYLDHVPQPVVRRLAAGSALVLTLAMSFGAACCEGYCKVDAYAWSGEYRPRENPDYCEFDDPTDLLLQPMLSVSNAEHPPS